MYDKVGNENPEEQMKTMKVLSEVHAYTKVPRALLLAATGAPKPGQCVCGGGRGHAEGSLSMLHSHINVFLFLSLPLSHVSTCRINLVQPIRNERTG